MPTQPQETCWTILHAAAAGDAPARSEFSRRYLAVAREFLEARWSGRGLQTEVDDATQEVLLECLKPGGVLERADQARGEFRGLLFGVARNVARRFEERAAKHGRLRPEDSAWLDHVASDEPGQATLFDRGWARSLVCQAKELYQARAHLLGDAGRRRFELLERRFGNGEPIRHIAQSWGVPTQDVHNAYRKARTEFYSCLCEIVRTHAADGADIGAECRRLLELMH